MTRVVADGDRREPSKRVLQTQLQSEAFHAAVIPPVLRRPFQSPLRSSSAARLATGATSVQACFRRFDRAHTQARAAASEFIKTCRAIKRVSRRARPLRDNA